MPEATAPPVAEQSTGYAPPGRPLLDDEQSNALQNFFENPNNLDPSFAPAQNNGYQADASSFGGEGTSGLEWLRNMASATQQQTKIETDNRPMSQHNAESQRQAAYTPAAPQANMTASADDYAAAQLLLGNQEGRYNDPSQYDLSQLNGYNYPPVASGNNASPYNFNGQNGGIYGASRYPDATRGLAFGSDNQFRSSYGGNTLGQSEETALQQLSALAEQHIQANASMKRAHGDQDGLGRSIEDDDADGMNKRRRKGDEDDLFDDANLQKKGGKRRQSAKATPTVKRKSPSLLGGKSTRENLTEEQKRNNHIQSEQKRRNLIRDGFEELNKLVPELRSGGFSKSNSLAEACKFVRKLREDNEELKSHLKAFDAG